MPVRHDEILLVPKNFLFDKRPYSLFSSRANTSNVGLKLVFFLHFSSSAYYRYFINSSFIYPSSKYAPWSISYINLWYFIGDVIRKTSCFSFIPTFYRSNYLLPSFSFVSFYDFYSKYVNNLHSSRNFHDILF